MGSVEPIKAEVWMRLDGGTVMHNVGFITYEEMDLENGLCTVEAFGRSIHDFVDAMNAVLGAASRSQKADE